MRSKSVMALESRVLFDGAMLATVIEQESAPPAPEIPELEAEEPVEAAAETPAETPEETLAEAPAEESAEPSTEEADTTTPPAVETAAAPGQEIVFVDGRVTDPAAFQSEGREVIVLSLEQDGMAQIASALTGRSDIGAIHIVSHGSEGLLTLGSSEVTAASIQSTQLAYLQSIGQALSADGDILIYACDYASGASGLEAMNLLADITGADIAASTDTTGDTSLDGDWTLEQSTGEIETAALAPENWVHALNFTFTPASTAGAMGMAQTIMGAGVTVNSASYQGGGTQAGTFGAGSGVTFGTNVLNFTSGALLSTSNNAALVAGPNGNGGFGEDATAGIDGNAQLNALSGGFNTFDASILDINFTPDVPAGAQVGDVARMTIEVVFGSEEYLEYVNGGYNDVMAVIVNGVNQALVPNASGGESAISIDSVNNVQNPSLFVNNTSGTYSTQMDGFTRTIPLVFDVIVGQQNTIRLAIADTGDAVYDSWMFIRADSAQTVVVAEDDDVTTAANQPITVDLTANDYNLSGASMSLTHIQGQAVTQGQVVTLGSGIQVTVGAGGQVSVTGNGSSAANDTFTYQVSNGMGGVATATVNVTITAPNFNPPVAQNDAEVVVANATLSDSVLTNNGSGADTDPNGNPLSVVQINLTGFTPGTPFELASGALLTMNVNGTYVYNPNGAFDSLAAGQTGSDSFSYTLTDGQGGNDTAIVTITVQGINDAPLATNDAVTVSEEGVSTLAGLLGNDSDPEGGALLLTPNSLSGSNGGSISTDDSGNLYFDPGSAFNDLAVGQSRNTSFTYTLWDDQGASDTATVTITVQGANDAPVGVNDAFNVSEDGAHAVGNPLLNDTDPDSVGLTMSLNGLSGSNGGQFSMDDSGNLIFMAGADFDDLSVGESRQTSYTYTVSDAQGAQSAATVVVTVHGANDAAVGGHDTFTVLEDGPATLGSLTTNDLDPDSNEIFVDTTGVRAGDNGGLFSFDDSGNLTFDPDGDFNHLGNGQSASTRFDYTLFDGEGTSSVATVTVNVLGVNDTPVSLDDSFVGYEDSALTLGSVLANDSDVEGNALSLAVADVAGSGGGRFVVDGAMNLSFDPNGEFEDLQAGETRETRFTYSISDGQGGSTQAVVTVTVNGSNDSPVAQDDHFDVDNQAATALGSLLLNDTDVDGDDLSQGPVLVGDGSNGGVFGVDDSGSLSFDPAGAFDDLAIGDTRDTSFSYTVSDGHGGLSGATVTVTVHGAAEAEPQAPEVVENPYYPNEVVFVDARIPNPQAFALDGRELVVLTLDEDGLAQMAAALTGRSGIEAIHIVSHGGDGYLTLGSGNIDASSFQAAQLPSLDTLAQSLSSNGDILIYACDFASGPDGQNTMQLLAQYAVADVAASLNTTGHGTQGGDWTLESTVGAIDAVALAPVGWVHTLNLGGVVPQGSGAVVPEVPEVVGVQPAPAQPVPSVQAQHLDLDPDQNPAAAPVAAARSHGVTGFEAQGAARVVSLEGVFREALSPFMSTLAGPVGADAGQGDLVWTLPTAGTDARISTDAGITISANDTAPPAGWLATVERLDDSLVDEAVANVEPMEPRGADVDALQLPRQQAAPGFAAQLARWSQGAAQRPIIRAVARA